MGEVRSFFPAWRCYIFGVDVTNDLTDCTINYNDQRGPNTAEVTLVSPFDRYIVSDTDVRAIYDDVEGSVYPQDRRQFNLQDTSVVTDPLVANAIDEGADRQIQRDRVQESIETQVRERVEARVRDDVKRRILLAKFPEFQPIREPPKLVEGRLAQNLQDIAQLTGQAQRYPLQVGDSVFHTNDAVRIFWRDPEQKNVDAWYHMFAGFVTDYIDEVDANNQRLVRVRAEDASRILRYSRVTTNPGVFDIDDIQEQTDLIVRTFRNAGFANLTLPEFLFLLIFGSDLAGIGRDEVGSTTRVDTRRVSVNGSSDAEVPSDGIGGYNYSRSLTAIFGKDNFDQTLSSEDSEAAASRQEQIERSEARLRDSLNGGQIPNLGAYQAIVDHQVYFSDLRNMALEDRAGLQIRVNGQPQNAIGPFIEDFEGTVRRRGDGSYVIEDVVNIIGENPHLFPVDQRLVILIPGSLGPAANRDLLIRDFTNVAVQTSFTTRLGLIYDTVERIDFVFHASPRGDLLCEMPLYDYTPDDFGPEDAPVDLAQAQGTFRRPPFFSEGEERGPYPETFRVAKRDTMRWQRTFSDEAVRTQMLAQWNLVQGFTSLGNSTSVAQQEVISLPGLFPQFGARIETMDPRGIFGDRESALIYANVLLNKTNAEARTANVEVLPRVQAAFPNRPYEYAERLFIGTATSMTHTLTWGLQGDMSTQMNVKYIRSWSGQTTEDGQLIYEPIGGFASQGLNYALRQGNSVRTGNSNTQSTKDPNTGGVSE